MKLLLFMPLTREHIYFCFGFVDGCFKTIISNCLSIVFISFLFPNRKKLVFLSPVCISRGDTCCIFNFQQFAWQTRILWLPLTCAISWISKTNTKKEDVLTKIISYIILLSFLFWKSAKQKKRKNSSFLHLRIIK